MNNVKMRVLLRKRSLDFSSDPETAKLCQTVKWHEQNPMVHPPQNLPRIFALHRCEAVVNLWLSFLSLCFAKILMILFKRAELFLNKNMLLEVAKPAIVQ